MLKRRLAFLPETGLPSMPAFLSSLTPPLGDVLPKFDFDFDLDLANHIYQMLPEMGDNISVVGEQLSRSPPPPLFRRTDKDMKGRLYETPPVFLSVPLEAQTVRRHVSLWGLPAL